MRAMNNRAIVCFFALMACDAAATTTTTWWAWPSLAPLGGFAPGAACLIAIALAFIGSIAIYRAIFVIFGLPSGECHAGSPLSFRMDLHTLFFTFLYVPLFASGFLPLPIAGLLYRCLGLRLGTNSHTAGMIFDPLQVSIGANTMIGFGAVICPHINEGERLALYPIRIGSGVTIGAHAVLMANTEVGDGSVVAVGSVVTKGVRIPPGEIWGGIPARRLRRMQPAKGSQSVDDGDAADPIPSVLIAS